MTNTRPTFRPTAASFSAATQSPTFASSTNDLPFLPEGSHDTEREIQLHPERLCDIGHICRGSALEKAKDRGARFRLGPLFDDHDTARSTNSVRERIRVRRTRSSISSRSDRGSRRDIVGFRFTDECMHYTHCVSAI